MDNKKIYTNTTTHQSPLHLYPLKKNKRSLLALISLLFLILLAYNGAAIFSLHLPFPAKSPAEPSSFSPEDTGSTRNWAASSTKLSSSVMYAVKQEDPPLILKTHLPLLRQRASYTPGNVAGESRANPVDSFSKKSSSLGYKGKDPFPIPKSHLRKSHSTVVPVKSSSVNKIQRRIKRNPLFSILNSEYPPGRFSVRVKEFLSNTSYNSSCKLRFFMTWISPSASFGDRELFAIETVFKSHPNGCLIIVSTSMDSSRGMQILKPFSDNGFRVTAISPDFSYLVKHTVAEAWFDRLKHGNVNPGEVSLGQNLSNLLRLVLLYKFGGIYIDTDVIVLRSFSKLRNAIGAQTIDLSTQKWSRLNNAVMVFDKGHPLLYKFIEEFALTFDGNKWGHNGPYLVSRVVARVSDRVGYNFTVLPPVAFYPVDWSRIQSLFQGPKDKKESKWLMGKLMHIQSRSFLVHLWNKHSKGLGIEDGSIIRQIMWDRCVFCNSSASLY